MLCHHEMKLHSSSEISVSSVGYLQSCLSYEITGMCLLKLNNTWKETKGNFSSRMVKWIKLPLLSHSMSLHKQAGEWFPLKHKKRLHQNSAAILHIIQSSLYNFGNINMIWRSWGLRYRNCPVPQKQKKERTSSHYFKLQKSWHTHLVMFHSGLDQNPEYCPCVLFHFLYTMSVHRFRVRLQCFLANAFLWVSP